MAIRSNRTGTTPYSLLIRMEAEPILKAGAGQKKGAPNTVIETVNVSIIKKGDPLLVASLSKVMRKREPVQHKNESAD